MDEWKDWNIQHVRCTKQLTFNKMKKLSFYLLMSLLFACAGKQEPPKLNQPVNKSETKEKPNMADNTSKEDMIAKLACENLKSNEQITLLDVRTPEEIAEGKMDGAMEIDFRAADFKSNVEKLDKEKTYYVYCRSGGRSGKTVKMMREMGIPNSYNILGGFEKFKGACESGQ